LGIFIDTNFLKMLVENGDLQQISPISNSLAIYSKAGKITHIGIAITPDRLRSKWGTAHLYEHDLLECPINYVEDIAFYNPIEPETCLNRFFDYAKSKGAI